MIRYWIVPDAAVHQEQLQGSLPFDLTANELHFMRSMVLNCFCSACLPPGDGSVHAALYLPESERVDLGDLCSKLNVIYNVLFNNPDRNEQKSHL